MTTFYSRLYFTCHFRVATSHNNTNTDLTFNLRISKYRAHTTKYTTIYLLMTQKDAKIWEQTFNIIHKFPHMYFIYLKKKKIHFQIIGFYNCCKQVFCFTLTGNLLVNTDMLTIKTEKFEERNYTSSDTSKAQGAMLL